MFLQVIAVKDQCLNFSNDSMSFSRDFRDLEKNARRTDGRTDRPTDRPMDRPSYKDAWTHLKSVICLDSAPLF